MPPIVPTNLPPVFVSAVFDDPDLAWDLIHRHAPYAPVQRYFASGAEQAAQDASKSTAVADTRPPDVFPVFRGDWAYDEPLVEGAESVLHNVNLIAAAEAVFSGWIVEPQQVYVNVTTPLPAQPPHIDIPAFCGIDRADYPTWLLTMMGQCGLFEAERVRNCTAVVWYYEGEAGGLRYWPDGAAADPTLHETAMTNTAVVGDNDFMFHQVERIGPKGERPVRGMTLDSQLIWRGDGWEVVESGEVLASFTPETVRTSLSWKARVFPDAAARARYHEHSDDLTLPAVIDRFTADFEARGETLPVPEDPLRNPEFIATLAREYRVVPPTP